MSTTKPKKILSDEERKQFLIYEEQQQYIKSKKFRKHVERNLNTNYINRKIFYLLHDPFIMENAYSKISKNKGALTEGYKDQKYMEYFGKDKSKILIDKIKRGTYKFQPAKRTWVPKPGKSKKRPIDVLTQNDRIVQEAVRGILEAIYEPVFIEWGEKTQNLCNNYGSRPNKSTWSAVEKLETWSRKCTTIIEGDIVSAYNHVDHKILLKILRERIQDKKFLNFIKQMLKCGVMDKGKYEHSLSGTPQGGIISPILFNIYLYGFDQYIYNEFITPILEKNKEYKVKEAVSPIYKRRSRDFYKTLKEYKEYKSTQNPDKKHLKVLEKQFKQFRVITLNTPYAYAEKRQKGATYVRYVDDWVLALTCTKTEAIQIKNNISKFLNDQRKMQLDEEKTKITHATEGYKFLGFEIRINIKHPRLKKVLTTSKGIKHRTLKRTTSRQLTIEPDSSRILKRLSHKRFCNENYEPRANPMMLLHDEFKIVQKYAHTFRGIYNYYLPCKRLTRLSRISYILQYSCARTLARRKHVSLRTIFGIYGKNMRIIRKIQSTEESKIRKTEFLTLTDLRRIKPYAINVPQATYDPFRFHEHLRTKFKIYQECCICGETEHIPSSLLKFNTFSQNKRQI